MRIIGMIIIIGMVIGAVVSIDHSKFLDLQSLLIVLGGAIGYALAKGKPKEIALLPLFYGYFIKLVVVGLKKIDDD